MSDIVQFVREMLEGKPQHIAVRGIVTHVIRCYTPDPTDPIVYEFQLEINGFLYSDFGCTRDPELSDIKVGDEILCQNPAPEGEGYPTFLVLSKAPLKAEEKEEATEAEFEAPDGEPFDPNAHDAEDLEKEKELAGTVA